MCDADNSLISQIASVIPSYNDPARGLQTDVGDFSISDGRMSWWGGLAFTNYLNSINYAGSNLWALPTASADSGAGHSYNATGGQFGQLFYSVLGGVRGHKIPNTANFTNEQIAGYWLATEDVLRCPFCARDFLTYDGSQNRNVKNYQHYAWAVSPGQVAAVPVPGAVWLMGSALIGSLASKCRGHAG